MVETESYFEYNGRKSTDFGLRILNELEFTAPARDIELVKVVGLDGDLAIDNGRYRGFDKRIPVKLKVPDDKTISQVVDEITEWLLDDVGWYPLKLSMYPGYDYMAMHYERLSITDSLRHFGRAVIVFRMKPNKYVQNQTTSPVNSGQNLENPTYRIAKPLIHITGNGNIDVKNNGVNWIHLIGLDNEIFIDSQIMSAYSSDGRLQNNKMLSNLRPLFPVLNPGDNIITWTGDVTSIEILPRWELLAN